MRLLLLSFYYPPDLSAGSFRAAALVEALLETDPAVEIDVVTSPPHRYRAYLTAPVLDDAPNNRVSVFRVGSPASGGGTLSLVRTFLSYASAALRLVKHRSYDGVLATSSRLMTATLGAHIASRRRLPLYLDIRDLFVDTVGDVFSRLAPLIVPALVPLERWTFDRATTINLVSPAFADYVRARNARKRLTFFTNGIDDEFLKARFDRAATSAPSIVLYAGNIGEGQGLENIVPQLAKRMSGQVRFRIVGDGGRRDVLLRRLQEVEADNVEVLAPMSRSSLIKEYAEADVLFLHLNDYTAFRKVLPSKLFEYAATGKPIWAGLQGFPAAFVDRHIPNAVVFPPCDPEAARSAFANLTLGPTDRSAFIAEYSRRSIMRKMATDVMSVASHGKRTPKHEARTRNYP